MIVDSTTGAVTTGTTTTKSSTSTTTASTSTTLDKEAFLQLLVTEMQYQDPLSPMDNTEYISQMATFSSLEQMQNLNTTVASLASSLSSISFQQSAGNIGKTATYLDSSSTSQTGTIDSVVISDSTVYYVIDGQQISADSITSIGAQTDEDETVDLLNDILDQLEEMSLVSA